MRSEASLHRQEISLLLQALFDNYGYDFREYSYPSINRRILQRVAMEGFDSIAELHQHVRQDHVLADRLLRDLSINVTEMFRDPEFFLALRNRVIPLLGKNEHIKIWSAGCATGEEVYSLAILLRETGLYERSLLYATDFNAKAIETARNGILPLGQMKVNVKNYHRAGGITDFGDYYQANYDGALIERSLKNNIQFGFHNLTGDDAFMDVQMIVCRNVLIYFNRKLQRHVFTLFHDSLAEGGFLCLGPVESLRAADDKVHFELFDEQNNIYRKKA